MHKRLFILSVISCLLSLIFGCSNPEAEEDKHDTNDSNNNFGSNFDTAFQNNYESPSLSTSDTTQEGTFDTTSENNTNHTVPNETDDTRGDTTNSLDKGYDTTFENSGSDCTVRLLHRRSIL